VMFLFAALTIYRRVITFFDLDAFVLQQLPKLLNLLFEFSDEFRVGILVDDSLADNLLGSIGVSARLHNRHRCEHVIAFRSQLTSMC
jgi:hypothetical protein